MARGKYVNPTEREQVKILRREGFSFSQIAGRLSLSKTAVIQAMKHVETYNTTADKKRVKYKRKTKPHLDRVIHRISEADRHKTAVDIHTEMSNHPDFNISVRTVQRRLGEYGLQGRVARKKPYISPKNRAWLVWSLLVTISTGLLSNGTRSSFLMSQNSTALALTEKPMCAADPERNSVHPALLALLKVVVVHFCSGELWDDVDQDPFMSSMESRMLPCTWRS